MLDALSFISRTAKPNNQPIHPSLYPSIHPFNQLSLYPIIHPFIHPTNWPANQPFTSTSAAFLLPGTGLGAHRTYQRTDHWEASTVMDTFTGKTKKKKKEALT